MEFLIVIVLILFNGLFALSEIALISSRKSKLAQKVAEGNKGASTALKLLENSGNFLSAIQVGITLIGIVTGVFGGVSLAGYVAPVFEKIEFTSLYSEEIALALTVLVITYISIVVGELVPKTIALGNPENIAVKIAPFISVFSRIFFPFVRLLAVSTNFLNKLLGVKPVKDIFTEAELRQMIKTASIEGIIEKEQNIIHENIFYFSDKRAKHIMTPRRDVEWVDISKPAADIYNDLKNVNHSKIICCRGDLENFTGVLFLKDYYKAVITGGLTGIEQLITEPHIVPETTYAQNVLKALRDKLSQLCFVVNEYGGFEGIITIHDIIENIIGQIPYEGDVFEPDIFVREDKSVLVSGDAPVESLTGVIDDFTIDFGEIEYSTVAGFVFDQINKIPVTGDKFIYRGYNIEIVDMDGNRIDKILISKIII